LANFFKVLGRKFQNTSEKILNFYSKDLNRQFSFFEDAKFLGSPINQRVCEPDKDDWHKLCHLIKYIRGTRKLPLRLSADGSNIIKWWVDA
jgi:hypothetical protein